MHKNSVTIQVHDFICQGFHGLYEGEQKTGSAYRVNLDVVFVSQDHITNISETISYLALADIIRHVMSSPKPLLETVAMDISSEIKRAFQQVEEINIAIHKLEPPIANFQGRVGVAFNQKWTTA